MAPISKEHPLSEAWHKYKATDSYANTKKWAAHIEHAEGSLWAAFSAGWDAARMSRYDALRDAAREHMECVAVVLKHGATIGAMQPSAPELARVPADEVGALMDAAHGAQRDYEAARARLEELIRE